MFERRKMKEQIGRPRNTIARERNAARLLPRDDEKKIENVVRASNVSRSRFFIFLFSRVEVRVVET